MADKAQGITPSDTVPIAYPAGRRKGCSGIFVGEAGDVAVVMVGADDDSDVQIFKNIPAGTFMPIKPKFVRATGTTATNMIALF